MRTVGITTVVLVAALAGASPITAQTRIQTAPGAFAYVLGDPDRPMIGVSTRSSGKRDTLGLLVESVTRGGPAEKAGIEEGDRFVSVNGVNLRLSPSDAGEPDMDGIANRRLIRELEKGKPGDEVELRVYRDGNLRTVRVATVAADELNRERVSAATGSAFRLNADRAVLGLSLGGSGSRRDTLGIMVVSVTSDGPAAKAGIDEGDRIAAINGVDLRVAAEDAGDRQASSARVNRLHREMEKVKAGDAVELRVYSAGQVRTVRIEAAKASDLRSGGFFFDGANGGRVQPLFIPRSGGVRAGPRVDIQDFPAVERLEDVRRELQRSLRSTRSAAERTRQATERLRVQLRSTVAPRVSIIRTTSTI